MASSEVNAVLAVEALAKSFGGVHAVADCTFAVNEGAVVGLIGPNGAGKSTAINVISGSLKPDGGVVRLRGREIQGLPPHRVSRLGLMRTFQSPREWGRLTVMENLLVAAPQNGRDAAWRALADRRRLRRSEERDREQCRELLREFALSDLRDEYACNLSGGQKRLLEFARIALAAPAIVLLDEPLAGVNPVLASRIAAAIEDFRARGMTIVLVEHNLPFVEQVCDDIVVMAEGKTVARGQLIELQEDPRVLDAYLGEVPAGV